MRAIALALATALAASPAASAGASVYLNGVSIDGATNQRFENSTVVIDGQGNVRIEAKGYAVKGGEPSVPPPPASASARPGATLATATAADARSAKLARRYFLATEQSEPDGTQYDVAIFINAQWIREIRSSEGQVVMEVTKYLRPGGNKVVLSAQKRIRGERRSSSPATTLKVVIGAGDAGGDHVMIDEPLVEMTRTAAELDDRTEEYVLEAR